MTGMNFGATNATNILANINTHFKKMSDSVKRLSSGDALVNASDNVANRALGTASETNTSTLRAMLTNTKDMANFLDIVDGALNQVGEMLQRQKVLTVMAGASSLSEMDRMHLNVKFDEITKQINSTIQNTTYGNLKVFDRSFTAESLHKRGGMMSLEMSQVLNNTFTQSVEQLFQVDA